MSTIRDHVDHTEHILHEDEPLLQSSSRDAEVPARKVVLTQSRVPPIVWVCLLMGLLEFEVGVQVVPTLRLYESAICYQHYNQTVDESKCKIDSIQQKLAWVRGWQGLFDALPSMSVVYSSLAMFTSSCAYKCSKALLLSLPFGYLADKKGRRFVLFISEVGEICCLGWILMTCEYVETSRVLLVYNEVLIDRHAMGCDFNQCRVVEFRLSDYWRRSQ